MERPLIAIVDPNTLAAIGLKQLLQDIIPIMRVEMYGSFAELEANNPRRFVHFFVAMNIVLEHKAFFTSCRHKAIVLTPDASLRSFEGFPSLCTSLPEKQLVHTLLALQQHAHPQGRNMPTMPPVLSRKVLSDREIEVMSLIVQGHINKEIADKLSISLSTVVTHRKNIMEKLGMKSVSALTIYAVMHGYVDINRI